MQTKKKERSSFRMAVTKFADLTPHKFNWSKKGAVTEIKDHEQCELCWSFSAVGVFYIFILC